MCVRRATAASCSRFHCDRSDGCTLQPPLRQRSSLQSDVSALDGEERKARQARRAIARCRALSTQARSARAGFCKTLPSPA
eukprot:879734-Prymnesium_polylepis.1